MTWVLAAEIGATSLYLLYAWLISGAAAAWLSHRKGYGERPGLASGMILPVLGVIAWLVVPPREDSLWKKVGPWGRPSADDLAPAAAGGEDRTPAQHATGAEASAAAPTGGETRPPSADVTERP